MRCHLLCWLSSDYTVTLYLTCLYWSPVPQPLFLSAAISWHSLHPPATHWNASHDWLHTLCSISAPQGRPPFKEGCTTCLQKWQHEMPKTYNSAILKLTICKQNITFYKLLACEISSTSLYQVQAYVIHTSENSDFVGSTIKLKMPINITIIFFTSNLTCTLTTAIKESNDYLTAVCI